MSNKDLALRYLNAFCVGDVNGVEQLLADELNFCGPLHTFNSASEYIESLRSDPAEKCGFKILSITESENAVAVFYEYHKPDRVMLIAQLFKFEHQKIQDILLVFDGRGIVQ